MLRKYRAPAGVAAALAMCSLPATDVIAGDHAEAPLIVEDPAADLADLYAWHAEGNLVIGLTWAGYTLRVAPEATAATLDPDVLYAIHIDTDGDEVADVDVHARFGQDSEGNWGVQVENLPGTDAPVSGPVETELDAGGGARVWAGIRDDPFFFDAEGFKKTLMTGVLSFDSQRDQALYQNATVLVLEVPLASLPGGGEAPFQLWATTSRRSP
jgi:hypothetical protein